MQLFVSSAMSISLTVNISSSLKVTWNRFCSLDVRIFVQFSFGIATTAYTATTATAAVGVRTRRWLGLLECIECDGGEFGARGDCWYHQVQLPCADCSITLLRE